VSLPDGTASLTTPDGVTMSFDSAGNVTPPASGGSAPPQHPSTMHRQHKAPSHHRSAKTTPSPHHPKDGKHPLHTAHTQRAGAQN
jgi:hypothetical protein